MTYSATLSSWDIVNKPSPYSYCYIASAPQPFQAFEAYSDSFLLKYFNICFPKMNIKFCYSIKSIIFHSPIIT